MAEFNKLKDALDRVHIMNARDDRATMGPKGGMKNTNMTTVKVSVRLWMNPDIPVTGFVDMYISRPTLEVPRKKPKNHTADDHCGQGSFVGKTNQYVMCSLLVQVGNCFGVRPLHGRDSMFDELYDKWILVHSGGSRSASGTAIRKLIDIKHGDSLVLHCGKFWKFSPSARDYLNGLPSEYKNVVKVVLAPTPLRTCDRDANGASSENRDPNINLPTVAVKKVRHIAHDSRLIVGRGSVSNEIILISSDDESDTSSIVEDVTEICRAIRDKERRKMMANALVID